MFYKIGFFSLFCFSLFSAEHVYLKTPNISQQEMMGASVGIRPFRKTGIRLQTESLQDKLIVHNYGYGGSGLTLAFGGSNEVLKILDNQKISSKVIAVLGAGVVGLATAYDLLEKGYEVHIYSDKWNPDLTSNIAAGVWTPLSFPKDLSLEKQKQHEEMLEIAKQRLLKSTGSDPEFAGVKQMYYYIFGSYQNPIKTTDQREEVVVHFDNGVIKNGRRMYRLGLDGKLFMEDLYSKVKSKGGVFQQQHFENVEQVLNLEESIIINCMSMGSREIFDDPEFIFVRGQVIYFKPQADIDYMLAQPQLTDSNYFVLIYPWSDRIILGGIYEHGQEELIINPETTDNMIKNAEKCLSENL